MCFACLGMGSLVLSDNCLMRAAPPELKIFHAHAQWYGTHGAEKISRHLWSDVCPLTSVEMILSLESKAALVIRWLMFRIITGAPSQLVCKPRPLPNLGVLGSCDSALYSILYHVYTFLQKCYIFNIGSIPSLIDYTLNCSSAIDAYDQIRLYQIELARIFVCRRQVSGQSGMWTKKLIDEVAWLIWTKTCWFAAQHKSKLRKIPMGAAPRPSWVVGVVWDFF